MAANCKFCGEQESVVEYVEVVATAWCDGSFIDGEWVREGPLEDKDYDPTSAELAYFECDACRKSEYFAEKICA